MTLAKKYQPKTWEDLAGNEDTVLSIKHSLEKGHKEGYESYLFHGNPGLGKTSTAKIMAEEIHERHYSTGWFPPYKGYFNASDDRGINFIREKIKMQLEYQAPGTIILDEFENMTLDAQEALRVPLGAKKPQKAVIIIANNIEKITDAIRSRCLEYEFKPLMPTSIQKRLAYIVKEEETQVHTDFDFLLRIANCSNCDMRRAINELSKVITPQNTITDKSCALLYGELDDEYSGL